MDTIAILLPVFNEEKSINKLVSEIEKNHLEIRKKHEIDFCLIFIDDGSTDKSPEMIKSLKSNFQIQFISLSRNYGKEAAISAGLEAGKSYEAVIIMDADLQHPITLIKDLIDKYKTNQVDMVYTYKLNRETESALQRLFSKLFYYLINVNNRYHIPQNAGDFRIMSKSVVNAILKLPENERFMKGLYAWVGFRSMGISFEPEDRKYGKSFFSLWQLLLLSIDGLTSFSIAPLRFMSATGMLISLFSAVYFIYIVIERVFLNTASPGLASVFCLISFFGGIQLICLGIIGEYIGKILLETKKRPTFIIKENLILTRDDN